MTDRTFAELLQARINSDPTLTEAGLAVKAGLSNSVVRKLLAGTTRNPRVDTAMKICSALGTTIEEFMGSPRTPEERDIAYLVSRLPVALRRQLLGYGQGLLEQTGPAPAKSPEAEE
ncbi:helix-turn-helix transcriptional regulator [Cypionkella sp.]|uniref:helix-turn-helix domain-containing protein n=1 Tax=Cypionkella sp. TaxID=2811411 RepID=UPI002ABA1904|nr:helix-turn-helix transcriptional regulator [Cypionkella sp.]MDZ4393799.1 helix-turn-helix transcriptional regulator [Cypionkella sp.]